MKSKWSQVMYVEVKMKGLYLLVVGLFLLSSCSSPLQEELITASPTKYENTPISTIEVSNIPTSTLKPEQTKAPTQILPSPVPTIPNEYLAEHVLQLLETNSGCELPCWWGISPGKTSLIDAKNILSSFERVSLYPSDDAPEQVSIKPPIPDEFNPFFFYPLHKYYISGDIVDLIQVDLALLPRYELSSLLLEFGFPSEVRINIASEPLPSGSINFIIYVYYGEIGILAQYDVIGKVNDEIVTGCLQNDLRTVLVLWEPQNDIGFEQVADRTVLWNVFPYSDAPSDTYPAQHLENVTELNLQDFFEKFSNSNQNNCIQSSVSNWRFPDL